MTSSPPRKRGVRLWPNFFVLSGLTLSACSQQEDPVPAPGVMERYTARIDRASIAAKDRAIDEARLRGEARASAAIKRMDENERRRVAGQK